MRVAFLPLLLLVVLGPLTGVQASASVGVQTVIDETRPAVLHFRAQAPRNARRVVFSVDDRHVVDLAPPWHFGRTGRVYAGTLPAGAHRLSIGVVLRDRRVRRQHRSAETLIGPGQYSETWSLGASGGAAQIGAPAPAVERLLVGPLPGQGPGLVQSEPGPVTNAEEPMVGPLPDESEPDGEPAGGLDPEPPTPAEPAAPAPDPPSASEPEPPIPAPVPEPEPPTAQPTPPASSPEPEAPPSPPEPAPDPEPPPDPDPA